MRKLFKLCAVVTLAALCTHCGNNRPKNEAKPAAVEQKVAENSIYHWLWKPRSRSRIKP